MTIQPSEATQGGFATEYIQVPNETDNANTTQVEVGFPTDTPIAFVSVAPVPGWTINVEKTTLAKPIKSDDGEVTEAVSKITWSGGQIKPGEFEQFPISMGPLPKTGSLEFKAVQTYDNGDVVRWIESTPPGGTEPEHPAPVLVLKAGSEGAAPAKAAAATTASKSVTTAQDDADTAKTIGYIGIAVGALGVVIAIVALLRKRTA